ncbi:MAG: hypothetical protein ACKOUM_08230, partial [Sphingopyxis sp.]
MGMKAPSPPMALVALTLLAWAGGRLGYITLERHAAAQAAADGAAAERGDGPGGAGMGTGQRPYAIPGFLIPIDGVIASAAPVAPRRAGRPLRRVAVGNITNGVQTGSGGAAAMLHGGAPAPRAAIHVATRHGALAGAPLLHAGSGGGGAGGYTAYGTHERYAALQRLMLRAI